MNRHNLELLFSWESFLVVPCKLLSLCLTLDVGGSHLRLREIGFIEAAVSRSILRLLHEDASHRGSYDASLDSGLLTSFHGSESTSLGKGNLRGVADIFQEWRGKMHHIIRAFDSINDGLFISQVSLHELKLVEVLAESLTKGCNLCLVLSVAHSTADAEAAVLQELEADPRAYVSRDTSKSDEWFLL